MFYIWKVVNFCCWNLQTLPYSPAEEPHLHFSRLQDYERVTRVCFLSLRGRRWSQSLQDQPVMVGNPAGVGVSGIGRKKKETKKGKSGAGLWSIKKTTWDWKFFGACACWSLSKAGTVCFSGLPAWLEHEDRWQEAPRLAFGSVLGFAPHPKL